MVAAAGQYAFHGIHTVGREEIHFPCRAGAVGFFNARPLRTERVYDVPAHGDNAVLRIKPFGLFGHFGKCHRVERAFAAEFEFAEFKTRHARIVACGFFGIRAAGGVPPGVAAHQVVLMPVHCAAFLNFNQAGEKLFGFGRSVGVGRLPALRSLRPHGGAKKRHSC